MGYKLLLQLIELKRKTNEEILKMAVVYYQHNKITDEEYNDIVNRLAER